MELESAMFDTRNVDSRTIEVDLCGQKITFVNPLNDHDYAHKNNSLLPVYTIESKKQTVKIPKKQITPKITCIKAVHNCKICGYNTMNKEIMAKHMKLHENIKGMKYLSYKQCPDCSFFSKSKMSLKIHRNIHARSPFKCTECSFSSKYLKQLIKHYNEVKDLSCDECSYATHLAEKMVRHKRMHVKLLICEVCGMSYVKDDLFRHHMKCHSLS